MPETRIALGIGPGGQPVPLRLTDTGALNVSGGAGFGPGASALNGVLIMGLTPTGQFVPLAVDASGNLITGVITAHSGLTGLSADDHPQYALRTDGPVFATAMNFTETAGASVYTDTRVLPANSVVQNVYLINRVLWTAGGSTATLNMRNTATANAYFTATTLHNTSFVSLNLLDSWTHVSNAALNNTYPGVSYPSGTTLTATITTTGAGGTVGRTTIYVFYTVPPITQAVKA
jgi:hypothetical protein